VGLKVGRFGWRSSWGEEEGLVMPPLLVHRESARGKWYTIPIAFAWARERMPAGHLKTMQSNHFHIIHSSKSAGVSRFLLLRA
jgi:hypothetical protein